MSLLTSWSTFWTGFRPEPPASRHFGKSACPAFIRSSIAGLLLLLSPSVLATTPVSFEELHELRGLSITASSADGRVVAGTGLIDCCSSQAFRWDGTGPVLYLETPPGQVETYSRNISADGRVVLVEARADIAARTGYRWLQDGTLSAVTPAGNPHTVFAISADGRQVAGSTFRRDDPDQQTPFVWSPQEGYRTLRIPAGTLGADPAYFDDDGHTLHGVGYIVDMASSHGDSRAMRPIAMRWRDGEPEPVASRNRLVAYLSGEGRQLSQAEADALDLSMPYPDLPGGEPMRVNWVGVDNEIILGQGTLSHAWLIRTRANGTCRLTDWLDALGVAYPRDARLQGRLASRDGRTLFGESVGAEDAEPSTPWRLVADVPLGRIRVSSAPQCGAQLP